MPPVDNYIARCDAREDFTQRNFTAVIQIAPKSQFSLKVLSQDGNIVYEKLLESVVDCWILSHDRFIYIEDLDSRKISYVKLYV